MKAIKKDSTGSVLINTGKGFNVWMDVWNEDGETVTDWNKYIFFTNNSIDLEIKEFQENVNNFELCSSLAIEFINN